MSVLWLIGSYSPVFDNDLAQLGDQLMEQIKVYAFGPLVGQAPLDRHYA